MHRALDVGSLRFERPLLNGSGVIDVVSSDDDWNTPLDAVRRLGAFVTKTVTSSPRAGHPQPWADTIDAGTLINSVGLANPGIAHVLETWQHLPELLQLPIIVSIGGDAPSLPELAAQLSNAPWPAAIELNLSCPNVHGGIIAGDPSATEAAVTAVRAATQLPVFAKLSPACGAPADVARAAEAAGADALTCGNTMPARHTSPDGSPILGAGPHGGMSGTGLHPIALRLVAEAASATSIPIVGLGGVDGVEAMERMFDAGASIIGVGTAAVIDSSLLGRLADAVSRNA